MPDVSIKNADDAIVAQNSGILAHVPVAQFIVDVEEFMSKENSSIEIVLRRLDEKLQLYKILDASLAQKRQKIKLKVGDLKNSIRIIESIKKKKSAGEKVETRFLLSDMCYATADLAPTDKICLWLGANVMVEYTTEEALNFLKSEFSNCESKLSEFEPAQETVKNYITTTEVNMARVFNFDVQKRKLQRLSAAT